MRTFIRTVQVLGLLLVAALAAGAVVSADSSSFRQSGYPTGPTGTATPKPTTTPTVTATPTKTPIPSPVKPKLKLRLLKTSTASRLKAQVKLSTAGKVKLRALRGAAKLGKKTVSFKGAAKKKATVKLKRSKLGAKRPVKVTLVGSGRATGGAKSNTVRKTKSVR